MEKVIISQNKHWEKPYKNLFFRDAFEDLKRNLSLKQIQVIQGIRRSGKSSLFKMMINHLSQKVDAQEILYINFDDPFFIPYSDEPTRLYDIVQVAKKLTQKNVRYLFLDEIQNINGWQRYVKSVYDSNEFEKIFVTGSNSTLLDKDVAVLLSGRYISLQVYPLSFQEILKIKKIDSYLKLAKESHMALKIVDDMMHFGSFVEIFEQDEEFKLEILKSYYQSILLKDCISNYNIRDIKSFQELSYYLISNVASLYSYSSLSKAIGIHDQSIKEYVGYLQSSYLAYELKQFSFSLKEQHNSKKKIYFSDNGFISLSFKFSSNYGKLFENLVFTELFKRGYECYFYNKNYECDFIVKKNDKLVAIQVCYELNEQNKKREFDGLKKLKFDVDKKLIITYNQQEEIDKDGIEVVSFWSYFSGFVNS